MFEGLEIWNYEKYRKLQGTYPVIFLSFAGVKQNNYEDTIARIKKIVCDLYQSFIFLKDWDGLTDEERNNIKNISNDMSDVTVQSAINDLSSYLSRYYVKKAIILLDEYDTPMQEAYVNGFWDKIVSFMRSLFNTTFKTNPYIERAIMTGITRVSKESIFSDLNNLEIVTTTSEKYTTAFGFTEDEVFWALNEYGLLDKKLEVKEWYDGFTFGSRSDIYNPWSIINFLDKRKFDTYWADTSSNGLVNELIRTGSAEIKETMETLMSGKVVEKNLDEQIVFEQLGKNRDAVWSLLLASGYLKIETYCEVGRLQKKVYGLKLTNFEVERMFGFMIEQWFGGEDVPYNEFVKALLKGDIESMNIYMEKVTKNIMSYFDTGKRPSDEEPEKFYHGLVLV